MKKLTLILTAFTLLLLLCACKDRSDTTAEGAGTATGSTSAQATAADSTPTDSSTDIAAPDASFAPTTEGSGTSAHVPIDNTIGTTILDPTEPTVGLPTPVESTYEIEDVELPPDTFD